ncbi:PP2C family protein-serine/threonine phosphatase [Oceanidesulfovibrio indonesiensis]|nr:protein phosphatase 2C domain-containing protein [Oceanidesulfovibrio indonesiensis]
MRYTAVSHVGEVRSVNEDRYLAREEDDGRALLLAVSDGMGGEAAGDLAAETVVEYLEDVPMQGLDNPGRLAAHVQDINELIHKLVQDNPNLAGMGATLTAAYVSANHAAWVHVGDSRLYLMRGEELMRITRDQRFIQEFIDHGELTEEQARSHPLRSMLDQSVGSPEVEPVTGTLDLQPGDVLLICSDGLHDLVSEQDIAARLRALRSENPPDLDRCAHDLVEAAREAGGHDNVTLVLAFI